MSKLDKDAVIAKFTEAYTAAHGKAPQIEAKGGWYSVDGGKNVRLAALEEMANELGGSATQTEDAETTPAKKPAEKKTPAKKKATKPAKGGFSVKDFWKNQVLANLPGSKAPR
jgi:hypothetical protein